MSLFLQGTFLLLDLLKKSNFTNKQITICFSSYYNRSPNTKSLDLKYLEAIEEMLNFASVTNVLQNMKKLLLAICLLLCALMPNFAEPTSSPQSEQIPMGYDKTNSQNGTPRTILPDVTAERSNSIVSVHVKRYTGYVSTYIVDSNGVTVSTSMGYAMDGQYDTNCVMDNIAHDSYTIHVVLDDCSYIGYFEM